ncbi:MAG: AmmeMemoRadiSam system radical SAM enzyme [Candidatus Nezhaarchaeales archaeon]
MMPPSIRGSPLYEKLKDDKVRCGVCERRCIIPPKGWGFCGTRFNSEGKLYTAVYGDINALESRPIEIKPFFHFWPGSSALTFSTWSCNFDCPWCQNYSLSKVKPDPSKANYIPPEKMVELAVKHGDEGICVSFTEPLMLFEYSLDVFKLAKAKGLYNTYVSNGYMTIDALRLLVEAGMDAIKVDVKGDEDVYEKYCSGVKLNVVWRNAREAKKLGLHVEIVNLVISGVNDDEYHLNLLIERHLKEVGPETPLHFTRYYPAYKFTAPPTKVETLEKAYSMAKKAGVLYPYIGNVAGHPYENTYCPSCRQLLVERYGYLVVKYLITKDKRCPNCNHQVCIVGSYVKKPLRFS